MAGTSARRTARVLLFAAVTTTTTMTGFGATAFAGELSDLLPPVDVPMATPTSVVPPLDQTVRVPDVTVPTVAPVVPSPAPTTPPATAAPPPAPTVPAVALPVASPAAPADAAPPVELPAVNTASGRPPLTFDRMTTLARSHAEEFAFPFALAALVLLFLAVQHRLSANDARLSAAPIDDDLRRFG